MRVATEEEWPALWQLMGAYLHQDFDAFGTIDDNIDLFVLESPDLAPALPAEVQRALDQFSTEPELEAFVDDLGCQVLPPGDLTYREWLTQIADRVRAAAA
ncbi:contact-dependent growth inhibition system immunity protein [Nocardioides conyzicola]|uniref:CdiI immunity protein domain-containing protein n=1 Tax=Nocardioides conyzicola TaxID=1651781 RepID=A0ABP8X0P0_9ACTN